LGVICIANVAADDLHMRPDGRNLYGAREGAASRLRVRLRHVELADYLKDKIAALAVKELRMLCIGVMLPPQFTVNLRRLVRAVVPVVTVTYPLVAPAGTVACRNVVPVRVTVVAWTPLNFTSEELLNPWPRIPIVLPTFPEYGTRLMNGGRLAFKL
jgi:hypothetical protein